MPDRVRLRHRRRALVVPGAILAFAIVIGAADIAWLVMMLALLTYVFVWEGISLTPREAVVYNVGRTRVPWSDVQAVTQEPVLGLWTRIVIYSATHGRIVLRSPTASPLSGRKHFDEAFHQIGQWWLAHRGPGWEPVVRRNPWTIQEWPTPGEGDTA